MLYGQARDGLDQGSTRQEGISRQDTCVMLFFLGRRFGQPGGSREVWGRKRVSDGDKENKNKTGEKKEKRQEYGKSSVPQGPVALGYGVRDVQEG